MLGMRLGKVETNYVRFSGTVPAPGGICVVRPNHRPLLQRMSLSLIVAARIKASSSPGRVCAGAPCLSGIVHEAIRLRPMATTTFSDRVALVTGASGGI